LLIGIQSFRERKTDRQTHRQTDTWTVKSLTKNVLKKRN
jgi:hypothetical protein